MGERYNPTYQGDAQLLAAVVLAGGGTVRVHSSTLESAKGMVINRIEDPATLSTVFQVSDHTHHYVPKATGERFNHEPTYVLRCEACGTSESAIREDANG